MEDTDIRSAKSAEMRAQFATVENYMVSLNFNYERSLKFPKEINSKPKIYFWLLTFNKFKRSQPCHIYM